MKARSISKRSAIHEAYVHGLRLAGWLWIGAATAAWTASASAADPSIADCLAASEASLKMHADHRIRAERSDLLICAASSCPAEVRKECLRRIDDVNAAIPTVVFEAKDGSGNDVAAVRVSMDGEALADRLVGTALEVDPGEHSFVFDMAGQPVVQKKLIVREGEKGRRETVVLATAESSPRKSARISRIWLGATVQDVLPRVAAALSIESRTGALVSQVTPDGPAFRGNVRTGDVITMAGGHEIHGADELIRETLGHAAGETVALEVFRGGRRYGASLTLSQTPEELMKLGAAQDSAVSAPFGLLLVDVPPEQALQLGLPSKPSAIVVRIVAASAAEKAGLRAGDVILDFLPVDGARASGVPSTVRALDPTRSWLLRVKRGEDYFYSVIEH